MSANDTELTFIRCPSCRSLVPSTAARCRMCGEVLSNKASSENPRNLEQPPTESPAQRQSRVRQRSDSFDEREINQIREGRVEQEKENQESKIQVESAGESQSVISGIRDKIFGQSNVSTGETQPFRLGREVDKYEQAREVNSESDEISEAAIEPQDKGEDLSASSITYNGDAFEEEDEVADVTDDEMQAMELPRTSSAQTFSDHRTNTEESHRSRRRKKKKKRLSFQGSAQGGISSPEAVQQHVYTKPQESSMTQQISPEQPSRLAPRQQESATVSGETGTLLGWFVSYSKDPRGVATEIRNSRFFIGSQRLRANDLVVDDGTVSAPHCLIRSTNAGSFQVQDLMSDGGTHIRKKGEQSYRQFLEPVVVENGDWLRLGQYEILVCLIPGVKSRGQ